MTAYEQGFIQKCASAGLSKQASVSLLKYATVHLPRGLHWMHHFLPVETDVDQRRAAREAERREAISNSPAMWFNNGTDTPVIVGDIGHPFNVGRIAMNVPGPLPAGSESNLVHSIGTSILDRGLRPREYLIPLNTGFGGGYYDFVDNDGTHPMHGRAIVDGIVADNVRRQLADK